MLFFYKITLKNLYLKKEKDKLSAVGMRLQESERTNFIMLNNLQGMVYRCNYDENWTMKFVSKGCYELTGYDQNSLMRNKISFNQIIHPEYKELLWEMWGRAVDSKTTFKYEYPIITAAEEMKWVLEQGHGIFNENGDLASIEGLLIDISDRKKREQEILYISEHDYLTGLYNRRYFDQAIQRANNKSHLPLSIIIGDINGLKLINDAFGEEEGDKLITLTAKIFKDCCDEKGIIARIGGDEFSILLPNTDSEKANAIVNHIKRAYEDYNENQTNEINYINISLGFSTKENMEENMDEVEKAAESHMYKRKLLEQRSSNSAILSSIKATMFERSQETEEHAERLGSLSKQIGILFNFTQTELDDMELLSTLHDIGKIGIEDSILKKPGKLTEEEWVEMKKHPEIGYRIAMASPELSSIAEYILLSP